MAIIRTLKMSFTTDSGKDAIVSIPYCRSNISAGEAQTAMDGFITNQPFSNTLVAKKGAKIVMMDTTTVFGL